MKKLIISLAIIASMHAELTMHAQQPQLPHSYSRYALPGNAGGLPYGYPPNNGYSGSMSPPSLIASPLVMLPALRPVAVATALQGIHAHAAASKTNRIS